MERKGAGQPCGGKRKRLGNTPPFLFLFKKDNQKSKNHSPIKTIYNFHHLPEYSVSATMKKLADVF
jgi:hypothetical protein